MDTADIKKKEHLTREHILQDIRREMRSPITGLACFFTGLLVSLSLLLLPISPQNRLGLVIVLSPLIITFLIFTVIEATTLYHYCSALAGNYYIEKDTRVPLDKKPFRGRHDHAFQFAANGCFVIPCNSTYYKWSKLYCLSAHGIYATYSDIGDAFYLVMHGKKIVMVYNTKLFEYSEVTESTR